MERSRARPLTIKRELVLFQSSVDIIEVLATARSRCLLGAGLTSAGFATFIASVGMSLPLGAVAVLIAGATANCYALAVVSQRVLRSVASRHTERLALLPTPVRPASAAGPLEEEGRVASLLIGAATVEERLAATPELCIEVHTPGAKRWLTLVDPVDDLDDRAAFGDILTRLRLLHIDQEVGTCSDQFLLEALARSPKVASDEREEPLQSGIPVGPMLSEITLSEVAEAEAAAATASEPPAQAIDRLGRRARNGGASVLAAGLLFAVGEGARDESGVARLSNVWRPGL